MFKKIKTKMIFVSSSFILLFLLIFVFTINFINYQTVVTDADNVLKILSDNKGDFPNDKFPPGDKGPSHMSPEIPYESRYFSVVFNENDEVIKYDISKIASINYEQAVKMAIDANSSNKNSGFINEYRFKIQNTNNDFKTIVFLDCGRKLDYFNNFLITSIGIAFASFVLVIVILIILSNKIIKPFATNYEKQKIFITDVSHELKTPLTIINTNVDILEMEYGENESFSDIHNQIDRLKDLTNNLVLLTKMEEINPSDILIESPISDIISEVILPFKNLANSKNLTINDNIEKMITLECNDKTIRQLVSILLENAVKYSRPNSTINIKLHKQNHNVVLSVINEALYELDKEKIKFVFERFYRLDSSRNSNTGGHGIGLSIAKAIANNHNAKISANIIDNTKFEITIIFNKYNKTKK